METLLRFWITVWVLGSASPAPQTFDNGKYVCHCLHGCEANGKCKRRCKISHFGEFCQYEDQGGWESPNKKPSVLFDKDEYSCITNSSLREARYETQNYPYVFHSVLFTLKESQKGEDFVGKIKIKFRKSKNGDALFPCKNKHETGRKYNKELLVTCRQTTYTEIIFTGPGIPFLCTIRITSGRNTVTLQKAETEGKIAPSSNAKFANDGKETTCLTIENQGKPPTLKITMRTPISLNILSIVASERNSFDGASIKGFNKDKVAFSLQADGSTIKPRTVKNDTRWPFVFEKKIPITSLIIKRNTSFTICEVLGFGDSYCPHGYVGFECDIPCLCANNKTCPSIQWLCGSNGCGPGYLGYRCDKGCTRGKYGLKCAETCPAYCGNHNCRKENGSCLQCPNGKYGTLCDEEVDPETSVRVTPKKPCGNCRNMKCDKENGHCLEGCVSGYLDSTCDLKCPLKRYGHLCAHTCPKNCRNDTCHREQGTCLYGCKDGYLGIRCQQKCPNGTYGQECSLECSSGCFYESLSKPSRLCTVENGTCSFGCKTFFHGLTCHDFECPVGTYGRKCHLDCSAGCFYDSPNDSSPVCDFYNGTCIFGCKPGYRHLICDEFDRSGIPSEIISMLKLLATAFLLVSITALVILLCWKKEEEEEPEMQMLSIKEGLGNLISSYSRDSD